MGTLLIIDAQPSFIFRHEQFPGYGRTIDAIRKEIIAAKGRNDYIIFVEYCSESRRREMFNRFPSMFSPTLPELLELVKNYSKKLFCYKRTVDGGEEVVKAIRYYNIPSISLRVCGVYTNACVRATVSSIADELPSSIIKVVEEATCAPGACNWQKENGILMMQDLDNVRVC